MKDTFKTLFCRHYGCGSSEFEQRLFRQSLYRHAWPWALVIGRVAPGFFEEDLAFLHEVGAARCRGEVVTELNRFYGRNVRDRNWLRKRLAIRVSGKRILRLHRALIRAEKAELPPELLAASATARSAGAEKTV